MLTGSRGVFQALPRGGAPEPACFARFPTKGIGCDKNNKKGMVNSIYRCFPFVFPPFYSKFE